MMIRALIVCVALCGFGTAARAGELDREAAPVRPPAAVAPAAGAPVGSELDAESPAAAWYGRGAWGFYGGWGYRPFVGYGWGYPAVGYGWGGFYPARAWYPSWNAGYSVAFARYATYAYGGFNPWFGNYPVGWYGGHWW